MKKFISLLIAFMLYSNFAHAAGTLIQSYNVSANVDLVFEMGIWLLRIDPPEDWNGDYRTLPTTAYKGGANIQSMDFGTLVETKYGTLKSTVFYQVMFKATTSGLKYKIQQSAFATGDTKFDEAFIVTPIFAENLSMDLPDGTKKTNSGFDMSTFGVLAKPQRAINSSSNIDIYTSKTSESPILGCVYGFYDGAQDEGKLPRNISGVLDKNTVKPLVKGDVDAGMKFTTVTFSITPN